MVAKTPSLESTIVSGFIPPIHENEARPSKPRRSRVRYAASFKFLSGVFFGDPLNYRDTTTVEIELPEEPHRPKYREGINYHDDRPVIAENEFTVPDSELVTFNERTADFVEHFKEALYSSAATLKAMDTASDYVGAALNDGLDLGIEMDERPFAAFVHLSRLEVLSAAVNQLKLGDRQKQLLISLLTKSMAEKAVEAMTIADNSERQSRILREHYHAVVQPTAVDPQEHQQRRLGVTRSRR